MRTRIAIVLAALAAAILPVATGGQPVAASGNCITQSYATVSVGLTLYGRQGRCASFNSPWKRARIVLYCTSGASPKYSNWVRTSNTNNAFVTCSWPGIPSSWTWQFSSVA